MIHTASCEHFDGLKFLSMPIRENHGSRVSRTVWDHFRFFGGLKTSFLPNCVTQSSRDRSFFWVHFRHLGASKCFFCQVVDHTIIPFSAFRWSKNAFSGDSRNTRFKGKLIFYSLASWKSDFWQIVKSTINWYLASRELIFGILAAWKSLFCEVVKTMV